MLAVYLFEIELNNTLNNFHLKVGLGVGQFEKIKLSRNHNDVI